MLKTLLPNFGRHLSKTKLRPCYPDDVSSDSLVGRLVLKNHALPGEHSWEKGSTKQAWHHKAMASAVLISGCSVRNDNRCEIFRASLNNRRKVIRNEDPVLRLRIGPSSVTQQNGFPIEPGAGVIIKFDPATAVAIYGISEGAALNIAVWEV